MAAFTPKPDMRIVVLHGREAFLMREHSNALAETLREAHGDVAIFEFDGAKVDLAVVLDELRSYGLLCPYKLVILDNTDQFLSGQETRRRSLERYAAEPVDHATLLLRAETWRPGKLDKLIKAGGGDVYKVAPPNEATAVSWCRARCEKRYGTTIDADAATLLVAQIGPDLDRLDTELAKLACFTGPERSIDTEAIGQLVGLTREQQAWVIQSAILSADPARALRMLGELLNTSRQPEQLVGWAIIDLCRKLHAASQLVRQGVPDGAIAKELKLWGAEKGDVLRIARAHDPAEFAQLLRTAVEGDRQNKRGVGDSVRSLETLTLLVADTIA